MLSSVDNIVLGAGKLYFDPFVPGTLTKTGERYLGSSQGLNINGSVTKLDHFNSDAGLRTKDVSVTTQVDYAGSLVLDNMSPENLAYFYLGATGLTIQGAGSVVDEAITVKQDRHYQLGVSASLPIGVRRITNLVVALTGGTPTYVLDTDYTVDLDRGRIYIIPGAGIAEDADLVIDYDTLAENREQVISAGSEVSGAMRWESFNPQGLQMDSYLAYVKLSPNGDLAIKASDDAWQQLNLNMEVLQLNASTPHVFNEMGAAS